MSSAPALIGTSGDSLREAFGMALSGMADEFSNVVVLDADIAGGTGVHHFRGSHPDRFIQFGIADQNIDNYVKNWKAKYVGIQQMPDGTRKPLPSNLDSMRENPLPTRAEASDVANAVFDGSDCVMLSAETGAGAYPVEAVTTMREIILAAERSGYVRVERDFVLPHEESEYATDSVARAACVLAEEVNAQAIISATLSGRSARFVAKYRFSKLVIGMSTDESALRRMAFYHGVIPLKLEEVGGFDESWAVAFNDVDFCLRVRATGRRNVWTPYATLLHHESKSRGKDDTRAKRARARDEAARLQARWGKELREDPAYNPNLTLEADDFGLAWPPRARKPWQR